MKESLHRAFAYPQQLFLNFVISSKLFKNAQSRRHKLLIFVTERVAKLF